MKILLLLYRLFVYLIAFLAWPYLRWRVRQGKEDPERLGERFGLASLPRPSGKLVWCHVASVGEAMSLKPLTDLLNRRYPDLTILITSGTVTSAYIIQSQFGKRVIHQYLPFDHPLWIASFIDHWRPDFVLWVESEIWPHFMQAIRKKNIPAFLINARLSSRSYRRWLKTPKVFSYLLRSFRICFPQNKETYAFLKKFSIRGDRLKMVGNLKLSAPPLHVSTLAYARLAKLFKGRKLYLLASSHEGEETLFMRLHQTVLKKDKKAVLIIVPRHPARGNAIFDEAKALGFYPVLRSRRQLEKHKDACNIYIADTLGELGLFYQLVSLAFIGGSFVKHGGHNPIEACHFKVAICWGPYMYHFKDAACQLLKREAAIAIDATEVEMQFKALKKILFDWLQSPQLFEHYTKNAHIFVKEQKNVPELLLKQIEDSLAPLGVLN